MVVNFRTHKINRGVCIQARTLALIQKKEKECAIESCYSL
jgi:hypothetical protein